MPTATDPKATDRLLTREQVAARLQCSMTTVRRLTLTGKLRYVQVGRELRFRPEWVESFIERGGSDDTNARR